MKPIIRTVFCCTLPPPPPIKDFQTELEPSSLWTWAFLSCAIHKEMTLIKKEKMRMWIRQPQSWPRKRKTAVRKKYTLFSRRCFFLSSKIITQFLLHFFLQTGLLLLVYYAYFLMILKKKICYTFRGLNTLLFCGMGSDGSKHARRFNIVSHIVIN